MKDDNKTKKQLVHELTELRSQNAVLEKSITGSMSAELAAEESSRYAENIVETVREPLLVLDADLKIISANRSFFRTFKVTSGETIGSFIYDLGNKQWDIPRLRELLETILPQKTSFDDYEVEHDFTTIGRRIMLLNARQIERGRGKERIILLAIEDITERKEIEDGLEKTRKELLVIKNTADKAREFAESVINTVREPLISLDQDLRVVTVSRSFYEFFKVKPEETVGQLIYDLGNKQWDIPKLRELLETILPQKTSFDDYEVEHDFTTIGRRIMLLNARQIERRLGKERTILLAMENITEQKRLENLLTESEERYRRLFETASDGIVLLEKSEGKITHANPAVEKMLGYTKKESIGNNLQDIGISLDMNDFQMTMQNLNKSGIIYYDDVPIETKTGKYIDTDIYLVDRARSVQCNIRDITDRKKVDEALRESEARYRSLFENNNAVMLLIDPDNGAIEDANAAASAYYGWSLEELKRRRIHEINTLKNEEAFAEIQLALTEKRNSSFFKHRRADGTIRDVEVYSGPVLLKGKPLLFSIVHDVTERRAAEAALQAKNEEIKTMSQQLMQAEKLATMGELAASIAHELNNPLTTVSLSVESLIAQTTGDDLRRRKLEIIGQEVERMGNLVSNLLQFSRRSQPQISTVNVCDEIEKTLELINYHLRKRNISVAREFKSENPIIYADRQQLRQLFLNLFTNASDAMPDGGMLTIRVTTRPEEKQVYIEIADTGVGIPPEILPKVLEPFYTTKPEGKGTGLGLAICKRIAKEHGGTLNITSEGFPGNGTRVCITLPFSNGHNTASLKYD